MKLTTTIHWHTPRTSAQAKRPRGFSLIEVNMAILVIGIGVLALMRLFPLGLHESSLSNASMLQTTAADYMLSRIQAQTQNIATNWAVWNDPTAFELHVLADPLGGGDDGVHLQTGRDQELANFPGPKDTTRYHLSVKGQDHESQPGLFFRYTIWVQVSERSRGDFDSNPYYYTEVMFHGMP